VFPSSYFSPYYFSPYYWPIGGIEPSPEPPTPGDVGRDYHILMAIADVLRGTGEFEAVYTTDPREMPPDSPQAPTMAFMTILGGRSGSEANEGAFEGDVDWKETFQFEIFLAVADEDAVRRLARLSRMISVTKKALNGQGFGGLTFPAWTGVVSWSYFRSSPPYKMARLVYETGQVMDGYADQNVLDDIDAMA
jgi:hypothetical protein